VTLSRSQRICLALLAASGLYSLALLPVAPSLLGSHPILLELLRGSTPAMITGGAFARVGDASLVLALLAPFPTLMMTDPVLWWAGRLWGPDAAHMFAGRGPKAERWIARGERWAEKYENLLIPLAYFLPIPSALVYAGAGWAGMSLRRFLVLDFIGTGLWVALNVGLGYWVGQSAVDVAKAISRYGLYATIALVVVVVGVSARRSQGDGGFGPTAPGGDDGPPERGPEPVGQGAD
jgi:membrane protein DedA with SNARE-associated domain